MAAFEGGLIAALTMAFGIAPGRRFVPRSVEYKPLALARIEPVLDVSDVCPDGSDADDTSALIERETRLIAALPDMTGHDLSGLMKAVAASGCRKRDDVVEFLGSLGVVRYADACWLESVYRN